MTNFKNDKENKEEYIFYDCETSGLSVNNNYSSVRLVQITWEKYTFNGNCLFSKTFIIKPVNFTIPENAIKIHGITNEIANEKGVELVPVLKEFFQDINNVKHLVGHNIEYDINVIRNECSLNNLTVNYTGDIFCTYKGFDKTPTEKSRKLKDRYFDCFREYPKEEHNSLADTKNCAKIFFWKKFNIKI
jgi:DNA polymerase III epsilon subunit-like protein